LLIYRLAVGAALAGTFAVGDVAPTFVLGVAGSVIAGPVLAWVYMRLTRRVTDTPSAIILQFVGTFGVWMLAERTGCRAYSPSFANAIAIAREAPDAPPPAYACRLTPYERRTAEGEREHKGVVGKVGHGRTLLTSP
jgi:CPA1 family monovalent cation:H+ antiporter